MRKTASWLVILLTLSSLSLAFQNCGNVMVAPILEEPSVQGAQILPAGQFCSQSGPVFGSQVRFAFIIDMSISNLGNAAPRCQDGIDREGNCAWVLGRSLTPAQDPDRNINVTTDEHGFRFDVIDGDGTNGKPRGFLLECGSQPDFQYSVAGFSTDTMFGQIADTCMSPFKTAQAVKANVTALRNVQNIDISHDGDFNPPTNSPFQMGETFYSKALSCLQKKIEYDAALTTDQPLYQVFFLTDGRPTDYLRSPCAGLSGAALTTCKNQNAAFYACENLPTDQQKTCKTNYYVNSVYKPSLVSLKQYTQSVSGDLKFTPIYYGKETDDARASALAALESMADAVSPDPATNVREISDFTTLSRDLCRAYQPQAQVNYTQKSVWAINMTSLYLNGKHEADSDMDGIADKDDAHPDDARSSGQVLDKLCRLKNGDNTPCVKPAVNCEQEAVGFGLNRCDVLVAKSIYGKDLTGFDTDNDGLPDWIEIRFGLNPTVADLGSANLDGDDESNFQEVLEGLNPEEPYDKVLSKDRMKWSSIQTVNTTCTSGSNYQFRFSQLPLSDNKASTGRVNDVDVSTKDGENLIALITIQEPVGRPNLKKKMTVQWIRTSQTGEPQVGPVQVLGDF